MIALAERVGKEPKNELYPPKKKTHAHQAPSNARPSMPPYSRPPLFFFPSLSAYSVLSCYDLSLRLAKPKSGKKPKI
jgi:hypothetical protein